MSRCASLLLVSAAVGALARGDWATAAANPSPEQADLQAAAAAVTVAEAQAAKGAGTGNAVENLDQMYTGLEAKYPHSAAVRDDFANFLFAADRGQEAFTKWQEAEKLDGNNADVCEHLAACWLNSGDTRRATGYFEKAAALAPQDASLHFALGNELYLFRHDLTTAQEPETAVVDRALGELKKASDLEPLEPEYARGYASTFYSIPVSKWPEALKAWQHYYEIAPDKDLAAINLARVSLQMKDKAGALKYLGKVNDPAFQGLKKKLMTQAGVGNPE
jgi:tetratricopeptide (TPR) repeat protein